MNLTSTVMRTDLPLPNRREGKVRDVYDCTLKDGRDAVLLVASDRLSAFDVVMPNGVPGKGVVLTQLSRFWFEMVVRELGDAVTTHVLSTDPSKITGLSDDDVTMLRGRVMIGRRAEVVPIECVARGYLAGSGWKEYQQSHTVCGVSLPGGLERCAKLPEPIFTPATKAAQGEHDENISFERACGIAGEALMETLRDLTLRIYTMAHDYAATRGIILADTKFEFGLPVDGDGEVASNTPILIDEVLTPDSSRFWPADDYAPGREQDSYDKQYVRNYLEGLVEVGAWGKSVPGPTLPADVVRNTQKKYDDCFEKLTGHALDYEALA